MLIPSANKAAKNTEPSLSRRVNANSQLLSIVVFEQIKLIKKGEC